jgi:hypothetical protein
MTAGTPFRISALVCVGVRDNGSGGEVRDVPTAGQLKGMACRCPASNGLTASLTITIAWQGMLPYGQTLVAAQNEKGPAVKAEPKS